MPTTDSDATLPAQLAAVAADAGVAPRALGSGGEPSARWCSLTAEDPAAALAGALDAIEGELGERDALLALVPGQPTAATLARCRDALWPLLHVVALYRLDAGGTRREVLQGTQRIDAAAADPGVCLLGRRRSHVMSPDATVEKFDGTAPGWDGTPGGPGYPHFRWMRRFVARFAGGVAARRVLDFGCGAGWVGIEAARERPGCELCAFDPSPEMVRIATHNAEREGVARFEGRTGFGEDPPFPGPGEAPFDLVLSSGVISFAPDPERWLDGLVGTVRPGGTLVVGDLHGGSRGMRARRAGRPLLPVRELNAVPREVVRAALERRGFVHERWAGYQLTFPLPQAMHVNETRLRGALTWPLLWTNQVAAALDRGLGSPAQDRFDSWVMRLRAPG